MLGNWLECGSASIGDPSKSHQGGSGGLKLRITHTFSVMICIYVNFRIEQVLGHVIRTNIFWDQCDQIWQILKVFGINFLIQEAQISGNFWLF